MTEPAIDLLGDCWLELPDGQLRNRVEQFLKDNDKSELCVLLCGACVNGRPDDCSGWCGVISGKVDDV